MGDDVTEAEQQSGSEKPSGGVSVVGIILPAILAALGGFGGGFGGAMLSGGGTGEDKKMELEVPGPTVPLQPFILNLLDAQGKQHAMKITLSVELEPESNVAQFESFVPRVRNMTLSYLATLTFEEAKSTRTQERMRKDLVERIKELGAKSAKVVLVQDLVMQ